jgi:hypothetical protein
MSNLNVNYANEIILKVRETEVLVLLIGNTCHVVCM